jgi:translation initiation factor SUI1
MVCFFVSDPLLETQQHVGAQEGHVHIRIQQRNGRKTLTTVQGLSDDYDKKKIVRVCKKVKGTLNSLNQPWAYQAAYLIKQREGRQCM